jgi:hypothetical protein
MDNIECGPTNEGVETRSWWYWLTERERPDWLAAAHSTLPEDALGEAFVVTSAPPLRWI